MCISQIILDCIGSKLLPWNAIIMLVPLPPITTNLLQNRSIDDDLWMKNVGAWFSVKNKDFLSIQMRSNNISLTRPRKLWCEGLVFSMFNNLVSSYSVHNQCMLHSIFYLGKALWGLFVQAQKVGSIRTGRKRTLVSLLNYLILQSDSSWFFFDVED